MRLQTGLTLLVFALALVGHLAIWIGLVNRLHSFGLSRAVIKGGSLVCLLAAALPLAYVAWQLFAVGWPAIADWQWRLAAGPAYVALVAGFGATLVPLWLAARRAAARPLAGVTARGVSVIDVAQRLGSPPVADLRTKLLARVPGNELWQLHVRQFDVVVPRLAAELDGLSICHWSDLHISGRIARPYFEEVVRLTNGMQPDILALTGDICDSADEIGWLAEAFGPAQARIGKYFILGNHDLRSRDTARLRAAIAEAGFVDVAGRELPIAEGRLTIAGDERPWFPACPSGDPPPDAQAGAQRLLLAHTPDRFAWACANGFDLMLAGHSHGGQVCFPVIGPVLCPCRHGTRYVSGFFRAGSTLMYVTRGTASHFQVRWNCPPEIVKIVLRAKR